MGKTEQLQDIEKIITIRPNGTKKVSSKNNHPTRTQKQHRDDVDVNNIMAKYKRTGQITHLRNAQQGAYVDLTKLPHSYQQSLDIIKKAEDTFMSMPSEVRTRFDNNPQQLINFLKDKKNNEEAIKLGLIEAPKQGPPNLDPKPIQP